MKETEYTESGVFEQFKYLIIFKRDFPCKQAQGNSKLMIAKTGINFVILYYSVTCPPAPTRPPEQPQLQQQSRPLRKPNFIHASKLASRIRVVGSANFCSDINEYYIFAYCR